MLGSQPWIVTGRTDAEAPILWPPDVTQPSDWTTIYVSGPEIQMSIRPVRSSCRNNHTAVWCLQREACIMCQGPGSRGQGGCWWHFTETWPSKKGTFGEMQKRLLGTRPGVRRERKTSPWNNYKKNRRLIWKHFEQLLLCHPTQTREVRGLKSLVRFGEYCGGSPTHTTHSTADPHWVRY